MGMRNYHMGFAGISLANRQYEVIVTIGRGVDVLKPLIGRTFPPETRPLGYALSKADIVDSELSSKNLLNFLRAVRQRQAGVAGWTVRAATGYFQGNTEPVAELALKYFKSAKEPTFNTFLLNALNMAEETAYAFAQLEILVGVEAGADGRFIYRVSPTGFPPPGSKKLGLFLEKARLAP